MSTPISNSVAIMWSAIQNVLVATASATNSTALPAGCVSVMIVAPMDCYVNLIASASVSGAGQLFVKGGAAPLQFDAGVSQLIGLKAMTSANPMAVCIIPLSS